MKDVDHDSEILAESIDNIEHIEHTEHTEQTEQTEHIDHIKVPLAIDSSYFGQVSFEI